ncbi:multivesicular body subunit 12B-like isoform X1 [Varroa destructor]|uniref:Multivesicular body subunit 12B n=1 Tax=Varroa destructor TaxID=109461 RepID=A0A7M7KVD7_VARDE|nr:multivesicular body subunit 12B-like isoform X1 [Varroa destructor]XP_022672580.1 multivesicular body subunit 12B-like isoform X1 [Varroa destructor]XP_022672581.1 multivesicular body subunit 12B-like isoform X1 [Varroa destructor]XP_022672582.1 multivesicular body subunit 12B-like isoform X1 [Varroa destructor]XP_022672583.1 multivesicular body subunit 12B-like isoform X1 [Varroa destructor]
MEPITDICIIEEAKNAPPGYSVIELTGDAGVDADLWKDKGLFFGRKETRYLCFARKFSLDCLESLSVQQTPPPNVLTISSTRDTGQKCLKKRHLCYTVISRDIRNSSVVSDIGVFSKSAPEGFTLAGELNGLLIAYRTIKINVESNGSLPKEQAACRAQNDAGGAQSGNSGSVLCARNWIDDISYRLNPGLLPVRRLPAIHLKTASQIYSQFNYDFSLEREVLRAVTPDDTSNVASCRGEGNSPLLDPQQFAASTAAATASNCNAAGETS